MESKYKVGDTVKIKQLSVDGDYRHGINSEMIEQAGKTFKIISVSLSDSPACKIPDDGFTYRLDGISWAWASSMFEDSSEALLLEEPSIDNSLDAFIAKKTCPKLDFTL
jgi:hypothetical protein